MSLFFKIWIYFLLTGLVCINVRFASAQTEIGVAVHVNRLPQGTYPTKIYQFSNTPGLVMVTLTNHNGTAYTIYLNGGLTGDNGVQIATAKGYQPASIALKPFETKSLNAIEAANLFDPNSLVYLSGSTSIKPSVFGEQGLPEGTYQVCVRAYDASTHRPLSEEDPLGCSNIFSISTLEPPVILTPMDEDSLRAIGPQNIPFRWTTPPGAPPSTQYTVRLVEIFGDRNPNDAMRSTTTPFFETTVQGSPMLLYSPQYPQMKEGRSYAMMVTAVDPSGGATFRNNGRSEVIQFAYGKLIATAISNTMSATGIVTCSPDCQMPVSDTRVKRDLSGIQAGSKLLIDGLDLVITRIDNLNNGTINGEGKIQVPVLKFIPVSVSLQNIQINASNQVISGKAVAKRRTDAASLLPDYDPTNPNLTIDPSQAQHFTQYISNYISSNLNPQDALGYSLPLGISNVSASQVTIAVTNMVVTPQQAYFDAGAAFDIPEASMTVALGGRGICFSKDKTLCGQGMLYLAKDIDLSTTGIALKAQDATDPGTYIEFGTDGFKSLRIRGEYDFSAELLEKKGGGIVKAQLTVEAAESWANWIASVSIDPFHIKGDDNFGFAPGTAYYDHSDKKNPDGMPSYYEEVIEPTWRGFFIPEMQIELPALIKKFANSDRLLASAQNFIIDGQGISGTLGLDNLVSIDDGALSSWQYSVDRIEAVFRKNSFTEGNMTGRILLPIASADDPNSQLNYSCKLSVSNGLNFQFVVQPKDNIDIPMWIVHMNIDKSSYVEVTAGNGFNVSAVLTGNISFQPKLPGLGAVDIKAVSFQHLTINSSEPYISDGSLVTGQSSPEKFLNGFPVSFREPPKLSPNRLGLMFSINVTLADVPSLPAASTTFSVTGGFDLVNGRLRTQAPKFFLDEISLVGWIGPVQVNGMVRFVDNNPTFGNGIEGVIKQATFPPGFTIQASVFFGKKDFNYFFVGANFNLPPPGIPIGGGIIPLSIFGFGGGVYYNMTLRQEPMAVNRISEADPMSMYLPAEGISGFKGSMTIGTSDGSVFVAMGTLSAEIDRNSLALHKLAINVDAGMYTKLAEISNAMIQGTGFIQYDFSQEEFTAAIRMDINLPGGFIKGSGTLGLLTNFKSGDWYFKMGEAAPGGDKVTLSLSAFDLVKFNFQSYQNIGNNLRLPAKLQSVYDAAAGRLITTDSYTNPLTLQTQPLTKVAGVLLGASASAGMDLEFLIFYLSMKAELGFDLALLQDSRKCDDGDQMGLNGYYAFGDLYASGSFDFGLNVNVWFFKGKVSAAKIGFSTTLQAGFANPFMFDGWLEADYSVLEGLVSGHMNFHVKYSSAGEGGCVLTSNPFGGMPLISDIIPHDGDQDVSVFVSTGAAFNFPVNEEFSVAVRNERGENELKKLKVVISSFSLTNNKTGQVFSASMDLNGNYLALQNGGQIHTSSHNAWLYGWSKTLDPQTSFTVSVIADGYLWELQGGWKKVDSARDTKTAVFKTGDCIKTLTEQGAVLSTYPFPNQRYFLPKHYPNGYIYLKLATDCLQNPPAKTGGPQAALAASQVARYDLYAEFDSEKDHFETAVSNDNQQLNFVIPDQLSPSTIYRLRIVKRAVMGPSALLANMMQVNATPNAIQLKQVNIIQSGADQSNSNLMKNSLFIQDHAAIAALSTASMPDIELYSYYFRTSRFKTLEEKMTGVSQDGAASWSGGWGGTGPIPGFNLNMREAMDEYDAKGFFVEGIKNNIAQTRTGGNVFIPPIFNLDENYYDNPWMQQVIFPITQEYLNIAPFDAEQTQHSKWRLLAPVGGNSTFIKGMEPFQVSAYESPLGSNEIPMALKVQQFMVAPNLATSTAKPQASGIPAKNVNQIIKKVK